MPLAMLACDPAPPSDQVGDGPDECAEDTVAVSGELTPVDPASHAMPSWFTDAKFGIFIHWGVYSVPAWAPVGQYAEWYWLWQTIPLTAYASHHDDTYGPSVLYDDFIPSFRAERWDPEDWIALIKASGARYWVLTTKHHDGFLLWPSDTTGRNAGELGPKRDIVGDLMEANRCSGLKAGLYYSLPEWFTPAPRPPMYGAMGLAFENPHPIDPYTGEEVPYTGYRPVDDYATGQVIPQIREIIDRYHPSILWCDIGGDPAYYQSETWLGEFYADGVAHHPEGVVANNRCGLPGDYETPEYDPIPAADGRFFESTRGLGASFGYNRAEQVDDYLTDAEAIFTLVDTVAAGGNLLLDIGPEADGTVPQVMRDRLLAMGRWLDLNGEAIYATAPWAMAQTDPVTSSVRYTVGADGNLYALAEGWPGAELALGAPVALGATSVITLLGGDGGSLAHRTDGDQLVITMPDPSTTAAEHAFVLRITGTNPQPAPRPTR